MFIHHVFFWLKNDLSKEDVGLFESGVTSLPSIEHISFGDVGKPAATDRHVIDKSYSYSLMLQFKDQESHDAYQLHPTHIKFVDNCSRLWEKVLIYDSQSV